MKPEELSRIFLNSQSNMTKYREAIDILREIGFETLVRRIGEPLEHPLDHPQSNKIAQASHHERVGWYAALATVFSFEESVGVQDELTEPIEADYGATQG